MSDSEYTSDDEEAIDSLMGLLDGIGDGANVQQKDVSTKSARQKFKQTSGLFNLSLNENGKVNYRDKQVLGNHPSLVISAEQRTADRLKVGIYLNHEVPLDNSTTVQAPELYEPHTKSTNVELSKEFPISKHEFWVNPSDISDGIVQLKKRSLKLSRGFRNATGKRWPRFVFVVTSYGQNPSISISEDFEVRSKEQSNKVRAGRGLSASTRRRRTPESAALDDRLRQIQAEIISLGEQIQAEKSKRNDFKGRFEFIKALTHDSYMAEGVEISTIISNIKCI